MTVQTLLDRLDKVRRVGRGSWFARCPAHEDRSPSLHITEKDDGAILLHDFGQKCGAVDILAAIGLEPKDLFPERLSDHIPRKHRPVIKADVFHILRHEAKVVWLIARDVDAHKTISETDMQRLRESVRRLEQINDAAYGER